MREFRLTGDKSGNRLLIDIRRADRKCTISQSPILHGSTPRKYLVLTIRSMSPITGITSRGRTKKTPSNILLAMLSDNLPTSSTTRPLSRGDCETSQEPHQTKQHLIFPRLIVLNHPNHDYGHEGLSRIANWQTPLHPPFANGKQD